MPVKKRLTMGMILALAANLVGAQDLEKLTTEARTQSARLIQELGTRLKQELAAGGPVPALDVCKDAAPEIASRLSRESGARIARVSLKPRNPLLGTPDAWEQSVLLAFEQRAASGETLQTMDRAEIVVEPQGRYFRYMKAIALQPMCVTCHGSNAAIPASVKALLHAQYPHDRATGYEPGQVRGAVTFRTFLGE